MLYLLYGSERFLINKETKKILNKYNLDDINVSKYDLNSDFVGDIIDDAQTMSMFMDKKAIIVDNSFIFTRVINKDKDIASKISDYITNPNPDTIIIFIVNSDKIDERKKIVKDIKVKGAIKDFIKKKDVFSVVSDMFDGYTISDSDIRYFIDRCGNNLDILNNEALKLKIYKGDDTTINKEDISDVTIRNINIDIFTLIDAIINKEKKKALEGYYELLKNNEEPIKILIVLANQFRIMYQARELYKSGYTGNDIASMLSIHPYRIKLALEKSNNYDTNIIKKYLLKLADLDSNIKNGRIDAKLGVELFILEL